MHKTQVPACVLIITGGNAAKLFQLEEKALHEMAFLVSPPVAEPRLSFIRLWRDAVIGLVGGNVFANPECSVSFVSEHPRTLDGDHAQQFFCNSDIVHIPFFCSPCARLARLDVNAVDADILQICVRTEVMEYLLQKPCFLPLNIALIDGLPRSVSLRQIFSCSATARDLQNPVQYLS